MDKIEDKEMQNIVGIIEKRLTARDRTNTILSFFRSVGRLGGIYHLKAQGRTALLFQCLKINMQMTNDRRALG